jgi:hypothetical protein
MPERKAKQILKVRIARGPLKVNHLRAEPRDQVVWRDGKPVVLKPVLCRLHNQPWQTCTLCSATRAR